MWVVAENELVDQVKKNKNNYIGFEVSFERAYDFISQGFHEYMLRGFGFGDQWCVCMCACVFSRSICFPC